jgi:hypothetical protein
MSSKWALLCLVLGVAEQVTPAAAVVALPMGLLM